MPTWKKILTEDSPAANLGNSNLTVTGGNATSSSRLFTLPPATFTSNLQFRGTVNGNVRTFLRIEADSDSGLLSQNYVYVNCLRIGNFGLSSETSQRGYSLPQHSNVGTGKIITSTGAWADNYGETSFVSFDDWMDPGFSSGHGFASSTNYSSGPPSDDKVIVYDSSASAYRPSTLSELSNAQGYVYAFQMSRESTFSLTGTAGQEVTVFLGGNFGSPGFSENGDGHIILEDNSFIMGFSWRSYVTNYYNQPITPGLLIDGSSNWVQTYNGVTYNYNDDEYDAAGKKNSNLTNSGHEVKNTHVFQNPIPISSGQALSGQMTYNVDSNGTAAHHLICIWVKTFNSNFGTPTIV